MQYLYDFADDALKLLPDSPFKHLGINDALNEYSQMMGWINYFVPVGTMLGILTTYLTGVGLWYAVRWLLRLAQYID